MATISSIEEPKLDNPFTQGLCIPVLVDADLISYRAAFSPEVTDEKTCHKKVDEVVEFIKNHTSTFDVGQYEFYLTGKGNFRNEVAVTAEYKGNRKGKEKPEWLATARDYIVNTYNANVSVGQECDDSISIRANELDYNCIAASTDKDYLMIPCWHYNFGRNEWYKPTPWESTKFFYQQILMGDNSDNIVGLWRVGPVKALKILEDCQTEADLYAKVVEAYEGNTTRVLENARLLWLRQYEDEMWVPPAERISQPQAGR